MIGIRVSQDIFFSVQLTANKLIRYRGIRPSVNRDPPTAAALLSRITQAVVTTGRLIGRIEKLQRMSAKALIANLQTGIRIPHPLTVPLAFLNRHSRILEEEVCISARRDVRMEQAVFSPVNEAANLSPLGVEQRKAIGTSAKLVRIAFASHVAAGYAIGGGTLIIDYLVAAEAFLPELNAGVIVSAHLAQVLTFVLRHHSIEFRRGSVGESPGKHVVGVTAAWLRHTQPSVVSGRF